MKGVKRWPQKSKYLADEHAFHTKRTRFQSATIGTKRLARFFLSLPITFSARTNAIVVEISRPFVLRNLSFEGF